jgi:hypothetical protein
MIPRAIIASYKSGESKLPDFENSQDQTAAIADPIGIEKPRVTARSTARGIGEEIAQRVTPVLITSGRGHRPKI